jgi:amidohydrolase
VSISHAIHDRPELGKEEVFASGLLADALGARGFEVERGYAGLPTAFLAARRGRGPGSGSGTRLGPRIAFLAEYDALPGIGHGCGHNVICSSALGAGIGLAAALDAMAGGGAAVLGAAPHGEVLVVGTPAEETDGAKVAMAASGCFDRVDAALMVHPHDAWFRLTESLAMDAIEVSFTGRPSHAAAAPWEGLNALDAVILLFNNVNALRQQMRPDARVHGIIVEGGKAPNVIPERAVARFYVRARRRDYLDGLVAKFKDCARASALATGTSVEFRNYEASFDDMFSNGTISDRMAGYLEALGAGPIGGAPESYGSIDMGNVSHVVPGVHFLVDIAGGKSVAAHTAEFREAAATPFADATIIMAAKALALAGLDLIRDPGLLEAARAEFRASLGREPGRS